eukprot:TRINITY_DN21771_c0_g1_i1.p1 TRINITY_DN21771_c0_g1~~TRINITY_DN21771_c0_g1_i1.p1  ORF type:complete len:528 (+),score=109.54 TRINITY_DN21771_c0_g1_i1:74-1657(+)
MPGVELMLMYAYKPEMIGFRYDELTSVARIFKSKIKVLGDRGGEGCLIDVEFENLEVARKICSRMVLLRAAFERWGEGATYDEVVKSTQAYTPKEMYKNSSFKFVFEAFGAKISFEEKVEIFNRFANVGLDGEVAMKNMDETFWIIEDRGLPTTNKKMNNSLQRVFFAREICIGDRKSLETYSLKSRKWIGTTTMIPELCTMMSNQACVTKGSMVWDPFCGTGSTLVSAAHHGAICFGSDLDGRALGNSENGIQSNCKQYNFQPMEILRLDVSQACWNPSKVEIFEAIISDPPYGRRESRKKIDEERQDTLDKYVGGLSAEEKKARLEGLAKRYIPPPKVDYAMPNLLTDLVDKAAKLLTVGGRLVYWHPTTTSYTQSELPKNPCLQIVGDIEQSVTIRLKRHLITMEKTRPWMPADETAPPTIPAGGDGDFTYNNEAHDSKEYLSYKEKREKKKTASRKFREENNVELPPRLSKTERRRLQDEQIEQKRIRKAEKQRLNHEMNRERSERLKIAKLAKEQDTSGKTE